MAVVRYDDARAFRAAVGSLIGPSEARDNRVHGLLGTLVDDPSVECRLWLVERDGDVVAAAVRTPPRNVVLGDAADRDAVAELAVAIASEPERPPGVTGNRPTADWFVDAWSGATGEEVESVRAYGVYALDVVERPPQPSGSPRQATTDDAALILDWFERFTIEAIPEEPVDRRRFAAMVDRLLERHRGAGVWLWERDDEVVSLSAHGNPTPNGMRIAPVYTPPEHRGHGYATALVAHQSTQLLAEGRRYCFLFTDLANPTSNAIYRRIGFRQVAESIDYRFVSP